MEKQIYSEYCFGGAQTGRGDKFIGKKRKHLHFWLENSSEEGMDQQTGEQTGWQGALGCEYREMVVGMDQTRPGALQMLPV